MDISYDVRCYEIQEINANRVKNREKYWKGAILWN